MSERLRHHPEWTDVNARKTTPLLLAILAGALGLRVLVVATDLPYFLSLDELDYVESGLRFGSGTFEMSSFMHGAFYQIILALEFAVYFVVGRVQGLFRSPQDFLLAYLKDPTSVFLLARMTAVLCGTGVAWLTYAIGSRLYNERVGLAAGLFTAFSLLMFQMSFLALADVPAVFLLMLATYLVVRSIERPKDLTLYSAAAALIGLAAACKYHSGLGIGTLLVGAFLKSAADQHRMKAFLRLGILGGIVSLAAFCVGIPHFVFDPVGFYNGVFLKLGSFYIGSSGESAWLFPFTHHLRSGLGIPLEIASLLGLAFALYKRSDGDILIVSFPAFLYLVLMHSVGFAYHLVPALPFLLILAARLIDAAAENVLRRPSLVASLLLATAVATPTFLDSARFVSVLRSPGTKTTAKAWIEAHIPQGSTIMAEGYIFTTPTFGPPLVESPSSLERDIAFVKEQKGAGRIPALRLAHYDQLSDSARAYDVLKVGFLNSKAIASRLPRFLVMTSDMDSPAGRELESLYLSMSDEYGEKRVAVKEDIQRGYLVRAIFAPTEPFTRMFPHLMDEDYRALRSWPLFAGETSRGPTITVWERRAE